MNLEYEIMLQFSAGNTKRVADIVLKNTSLVKELVDLTLGENEATAKRAAWVLGYVGKENPSLFLPFLEPLLGALIHPNNNAVKRNIVSMLQYMELPKRWQGIATETCFRLIEDPKETIAVKAFSYTVLGNICQQNTAMREEMLLYFTEVLQVPLLPAALAARAKRELKRLTKKK